MGEMGLVLLFKKLCSVSKLIFLKVTGIEQIYVRELEQ